jgi:hypothetical protein
MRITRRRLLKTTGAAGAVALAGAAQAQTLRRGGAGGGAAAAPGSITSWTLTETSGSKPLQGGSPFRFRLGFKVREVPSGTLIGLKDGAGNALSAQVNVISYWPDGSVRWCEVRGYTVRSIAAHGADTISISREG